MTDLKEFLDSNWLLKEQLDLSFEKKNINKDQYNKSLVELGYSFAINGYPDDCMEALLFLKGDYFQETGIKHFKDDEEYFSKCYLMLEVLNFVGYLPDDAFCTQSAGKA